MPDSSWVLTQTSSPASGLVSGQSMPIPFQFRKPLGCGDEGVQESQVSTKDFRANRFKQVGAKTPPPPQLRTALFPVGWRALRTAR